jgi:ABC-type glycerol-3-phosphate transport system substrate-binding protein
MMRVLLISLSALLLVACAESSQSQADARTVQDTHPWEGAKNVYVTKGWTPGDKTSWETQLRTRAQSQNEYVKVN